MNELMKRYKELGETFKPDLKPRQSIRVNTLKSSSLERLEKEGVEFEKISFVQVPAYYYKSRFSLGATPEYLKGHYYLQEAASMLPPIALNPAPGETVLDMTASPGSKTTELAQLMQNKGVIVALDINPKRLESLKNNIERLGVMNTVTVEKDARKAHELGVKFDKILLDAPCTGNFCVEPNFFEMKDVEGIKQRAGLQRELLESAIKCLKPGGVLVYSTCSLEPEENELNMEWLLKKYKNLKLEETGLEAGEPGLTKVFGQELSPEIKKTRRLWPHKTGTQAFFIARIKWDE